LNNKLDLDKLYFETKNHNQIPFGQFNNNAFINGHSNNNNNLINNNQINYPPQFGNNTNLPNQNVGFYQNFNLADLNNNFRISETYIPLDLKDLNIQQHSSQPSQEQKNEKDHFDFVNDLMKKKK
jgi:hypothetical protein